MLAFRQDLAVDFDGDLASGKTVPIEQLFDSESGGAIVVDAVEDNFHAR